MSKQLFETDVSVADAADFMNKQGLCGTTVGESIVVKSAFETLEISSNIEYAMMIPYKVLLKDLDDAYG